MKPFYSNNKKIEPDLSNDWEIEFTEDMTVNLRSRVLEQEIIAIPAINVLKFINKNNFTIEKNKIIGLLSVVSGKTLINEEEFYSNQIEKEIEDISYNDLKVSEIYEDIKGTKFIYLGWRYVSNIKSNADDFEYTKINKKHYMGKIIRLKNINGTPNYMISGMNTLTKPVIKELKDFEISRTIEDCNKMMDNMYIRDLSFVYFSKEFKKDPEYGLIPLEEYEDERLMRHYVPIFIDTNIGLLGRRKRDIFMNKKRINLRFPERNMINNNYGEVSLNREIGLYSNDLIQEDELGRGSQYDRLILLNKYRIGVIN